MDISKIIPTNGYCLVEPDEDSNINKYGIVVSESFKKDRVQTGVVKAVSPTNVSDSGRERPIDIKVGDKILFGAFAGEQIYLDESKQKEIRLIEICFVRGIIKD